MVRLRFNLYIWRDLYYWHQQAPVGISHDLGIRAVNKGLKLITLFTLIVVSVEVVRIINYSTYSHNANWKQEAIRERKHPRAQLAAHETF